MATAKKPDPTPETETETETEPETPAGTTYLADDVTNQPTGEVEQSGPVTYHADHVPDDAPQIMGKKVAAPEQPDGPAAGSQATAK